MEERDLKRQIDFYVKRAERFDRSVWSLGSRENRNHEKKIRAIADAIGFESADARDQSILEVGTGTGLHARWLLERAPISYWGLDVSEPMLDIAAERLTEWTDNVHLLVGDAQRLPFPDGTFSAGFCSGTLHHLQVPSAGVRELARVVRLGGRVAVMEPNWKFLSVLVYSAATREEWNTFKINPRRLEQWASEAGLEDVSVRHLLYTPPRPRKLARLFDRVDKTAAATPGIRALSINLLLSGRKA